MSAHGATERWDGRRGPGNLSAHQCMGRAIALAREHSIGCVALANTNHWMRGGTYGWQAADAGAIGICWTNTLPNMPPWGSSQPRLGNKSILSSPCPAPPVTSFSTCLSRSFRSARSKLVPRRRGEALPVAGGFDAAGELTRDAAVIEASGRVLPIGYWKGAGLSADARRAGSGAVGWARHARDRPGSSSGNAHYRKCSSRLTSPRWIRPARHSARSRQSLETSTTPELTSGHPGERTLAIRARNMALGVEVDETIWHEVRRDRSRRMTPVHCSVCCRQIRVSDEFPERSRRPRRTRRPNYRTSRPSRPS